MWNFSLKVPLVFRNSEFCLSKIYSIPPGRLTWVFSGRCFCRFTGKKKWCAFVVSPSPVNLSFPRRHLSCSSWWLNQPIWKICQYALQIGSFPRTFGVKIKNLWNHHLKPPPTRWASYELQMELYPITGLIKWVTGVMSLLIGVLNPCITRRGPTL